MGTSTSAGRGDEGCGLTRMDLSVFALESLRWLKENDEQEFQKCSGIVLRDANDNLVRTGKAFNSFSVLREIIEMVDRKRRFS